MFLSSLSFSVLSLFSSKWCSTDNTRNAVRVKPPRYRQVLCANSFTSLAELSLHRAGKARDPEMHQIRKGNEWRFGMKCHVGVDAGGGLVHTVTVTSANKHDITETVNLIREDDEVVYGDSGDISAFRNALKFSKTSIFPRPISELTVVQRVYPK